MNTDTAISAEEWRAMGRKGRHDLLAQFRLAFIAEIPVNWCEALGTVLANEEVTEWTEKGYTVERRPMRQWMMRITAFAERLLRKMSKSRGNAVNPDEVVGEYGADAMRLFEMFMGPLEEMKPWNSRGVEGVYHRRERGEMICFDSVLSLRSLRLCGDWFGSVKGGYDA